MGELRAGKRDLLWAVSRRALFGFKDPDKRDAGRGTGERLGHFVMEEFGEVFGAGVDGIERRNLIEEAVVELIDPRLQRFFDDLKFDEHAQVVEGIAFDGDLDAVVVAMDIGALAGVVLEEVSSGEGLLDDDFVHAAYRIDGGESGRPVMMDLAERGRTIQKGQSPGGGWFGFGSERRPASTVPELCSASKHPWPMQEKMVFFLAGAAPKK